ncbi:ABC transporter permease [Imhoffiella purpurea]|uniref:ABC transporter permease n=1 Tax=Imhoffiella purpurea TaxID=1249627 RepID=W9VHT9_9GAMM|nr:FtsX-like permease family protein [Imhoffiella purpurea]EXJ16571.1 Hypothetical protein D779_4124 [Imhoffiella purpurea]
MIRIALRHMRRTRLRTLLTLIGVAGSVALFVSLSAVSRDLKRQLDQGVVQSRIDILVEQRGAATPTLSRIPETAETELRRLPGIAATSSLVVGSVKAAGLPYLLLFGVSAPETYRAAGEWLGGGLIAGDMYRPGAGELVLGRLAARRLKLDVGDRLEIGGTRSYRVSGIYWLGQGVLDGGAMIDVADAQRLLSRAGQVNLLLVEVEDKRMVGPLVQRIGERFPGLHAFPATSLGRQIRAISMIDGFVMAVSAIVLLLSGVLILNTMLMAISERTREIGILMAVGWSRLMILRLILTEAGLLGLIGGLLGFLCAYPLLWMLTMLPAMAPGWIPVSPDLALFAQSLGLSVLLATLGACYPAVFATRLQPATAIGYE